VDDDESVRNLVVATLKGRGYRLLLARDSDEALQISDSQEGPLHLLIVDQVMPPFMSGPELAGCIRMLRPEVKVLYISGYSASDAVVDELGDARADFLPKPFSPDLLLRKIGKLAGQAVPDNPA
jgi:DNA-binding NtrC family response regulator